MNPTIINLDLAHNKFSDAGVADIIKLLAAENTVLSIVNLCNNRITAVGKLGKHSTRHLSFPGVRTETWADLQRRTGAAAMAEQLATNKVLRSLNLRLNNIGDEGGLAIFEALQSNTTLEVMSFSTSYYLPHSSEIL